MADTLGDLRQALDYRPGEVKNVVRSLLDSGCAVADLIGALTPYLKANSARSRAATIAALGALKSPAAWDALLGALKEKDPSLRGDVMKCLSEADDAGAIARLAAAAKNPDATVRRDAIVALSPRLGTERDDALRDLLASEDPWTRRAALEALMVARPSFYREILAASLRDVHATVRATAARISVTCDDPAALELLLPVLDDADREVRRIARHRLDELKLEAIACIEVVGRTIVRGKEASDFIGAKLKPLATDDLAAHLGRFGPLADGVLLQILAGRGLEGQKALDPILRGRDSARAIAAIESLLAISSPEQLGALLEIWAQLHVEVRRLIVERAASGGEAWLEPALLNGASDGDGLVRTTARQALVRKERFDLFPEASLLDLFRESLEEDSWTDTQREKLARAASKRGAAVIPLLERGATSKSAGLRRICAQGLADLKACDALWNLKDNSDLSVLKSVALTLGAARDPRALEPLVRAVEEGHGDVPAKAKKLLVPFEAELTVDRCIEWLGHKRMSFRRFSAERLGASGDERAVPPLLKAVGDPETSVQHVVVLALKSFVAREDVVDCLLECVAGGETNVRQGAIEALGEGRVARAVPVLVRVLGNPLLRKRAEDAIRKIGDRQGQLAVLRRRRRDQNVQNQKQKIADRNVRGGRNIAGPSKRKKMF